MCFWNFSDIEVALVSDADKNSCTFGGGDGKIEKKI